MGAKLHLRELEDLVRIEAGDIAGDSAATAAFSILSMGKDGSWILVGPFQAGVSKKDQEALQLAARRVRVNFELLDESNFMPPYNEFILTLLGRLVRQRGYMDVTP